MKACVKSGTKDDGNITFFIERHVESPNPVERRRRQIEVTLNSSNEHAEPVDKCSEPKDEHPPRRKRGKYAAYIKKKELSSMAEVKQAASSAGLKYINTVNRTAYFMCSIDGCPYKSRAVLTDEFRYDVLETDLQHNHGTVERKDGQ
uniref:Uncharacterized protein n=1 Tax=Panagrolaimus superbus TaxID=310955 RepID=A0A914YRE3_9BILA